MSRKEIVVLVSRAIALLQAIGVVTGIISLIQTLYTLFRVWAAEPYPTYRNPSLTFAAFLPLFIIVVHIVVQLVIAAFFWNCGPTIQRWLLPTGLEPEPEP